MRNFKAGEKLIMPIEAKDTQFLIAFDEEMLQFRLVNLQKHTISYSFFNQDALDKILNIWMGEGKIQLVT